MGRAAWGSGSSRALSTRLGFLFTTMRSQLEPVSKHQGRNREHLNYVQNQQRHQGLMIFYGFIQVSVLVPLVIFWSLDSIAVG